MKIKNAALMLATAIAVFGCHATKNLTVGDIRSQEHFYKRVVVDKSVAEIRQAIYQFVTTCRPLGDFHVDPNSDREAQMIFSAPGFSAMSAIVVMDFSEQADKQTLINAYSYYSTWYKRVDEVIDAINAPKKC
jgi:hypothetical protein